MIESLFVAKFDVVIVCQPEKCFKHFAFQRCVLIVLFIDRLADLHARLQQRVLNCSLTKQSCFLLMSVQARERESLNAFLQYQIIRTHGRWIRDKNFRKILLRARSGRCFFMPGSREFFSFPL